MDLSENFNSARPECFFVLQKNVSKDADNQKHSIQSSFYFAPFDTFYYVTLRKTLRASGRKTIKMNKKNNE